MPQVFFLYSCRKLDELKGDLKHFDELIQETMLEDLDPGKIREKRKQRSEQQVAEIVGK